MRNTSSFIILAVVLILTGIVFLLENFGVLIGISHIWPILPLILGIGFCMLYFRNKRKDLVLLGLGAIIVLDSFFFFFLNFTSWRSLALLWPIFILILGISFIVCYIFSKMKVLLYLAVFLIALSVSFILVFVISSRLWPLSLILGGVSFIIIQFFEWSVKPKEVLHGKR
jgi:hypothetical protein